MVRDVFRLARENSPSVVFIDEIDAIATKRFDAQTGADREVQRILLELLNQMDGFDQSTNVKVNDVCMIPPPYDMTEQKVFLLPWGILTYVHSRILIVCFITRALFIYLFYSRGVKSLHRSTAGTMGVLSPKCRSQHL